MYNRRNERKPKIDELFSLPNKQWETYQGSEILLTGH